MEAATRVASGCGTACTEDDEAEDAETQHLGIVTPAGERRAE